MAEGSEVHANIQTSTFCQ